MFISRGCKVLVNDIGEHINGDKSTWQDTASSLVKEINQAKAGTAVANHNNVLDGQEIIKHAIDSFGRCDILINNAGILRDKSFLKMTYSEWRAVMDVHLEGSFKVSHAVWPVMSSQNYGRIVNVGK